MNATSVTQGEIVEINVAVQNLGMQAKSFDVACYFYPTIIGTQRVTNLGIGESIILSFNWNTSDVEPGLYFIKTFVDSSREIQEYNEENNNCTVVTPVAVIAKEFPGILYVGKILISGPSPAVVGQQASFEILIVATNVGGGALTEVNVTDTIPLDPLSLILGTPSKRAATYDPDTKTITWNVGGLSVSESASLTFIYSFVPIQEGMYTLNKCENLKAEGFDIHGNLVEDFGENSITVVAVSRDVKAVSQTPLKETVIQGELVGIDVVVENAGSYYTESFNVTCYYNGTPIDPISVIRVLNLEPGESRVIRFVWNTSGVPPGNYAIRAFVDSGGEILESDEENNECTSDAYVKIVIHDIAVVSQVPYPTEVLQGETVTISITVVNEGTESESFELICFYYGEIECCESQVVENLAPGETRTITFLWNTAGVIPGTYYIDARAIPVDGELDTDDNACTSIAVVTVKASPPAPIGGIVVDAVDSLINNPCIPIGIAAIAAATVLATALFLKRERKRASMK